MLFFLSLAVFSDQVNGGVTTSGAYQLTSPTGHSVLVSPNLVQPNPPPARCVVCVCLSVRACVRVSVHACVRVSVCIGTCL